MSAVKRKYCDVALKMARTIKRGETKGWMQSAAVTTALEKHYANCNGGCGRVIEGEWPPR